MVVLVVLELTQHDVCRGTLLLYQSGIIQASDYDSDGWILGLYLFSFLGAANERGVRELRVFSYKCG
jgi:hypothetical protein